MENPYYKMLNELNKSYKQKGKNNINLSKDEKASENIMIYSEDMIFKFGKYRGKSLKLVISQDSSYILWCILNVINFSIDSYLLLDEKLSMEPSYYKALEINLIKRLFVDANDSDGNEYDGYDARDIVRDMNGDWGGLYGDEAEAGYWNTE